MIFFLVLTMYSNLLAIENKVTLLKEKLQKQKINKRNIPKYRKKCCGYFLSQIDFHAQKVPTHFKEQYRKRIIKIGEKTKKLFNVKKCLKNAQKLKMFSLKIHKDAGIFKTPQNLPNKGTKHK